MSVVARGVLLNGGIPWHRIPDPRSTAMSVGVPCGGEEEPGYPRMPNHVREAIKRMPTIPSSKSPEVC